MYVEPTTLAENVTISETDLPLLEEAIEASVSAQESATQAQNAVTQIESELENYVSKSGDTMTGNLTVPLLIANNQIGMSSVQNGTYRNIDNLNTDSTCGTWYIVKNSYAQGTLPYTSGQGLLIVKKQSSSTFHQVWIPTSVPTLYHNEMTRYFESGTWSAWSTTTNQKYYVSGDTFSCAEYYVSAVMTSNSTLILFSVNTPLLLNNVTPTLNTISGGIRTVTGSYVEGITDSDSWISSNYTITCLKKGDNVLRFAITKTDGTTFKQGTSTSAVTNNTPLAFSIRNLKITFS